jgi:hypothetical protein
MSRWANFKECLLAAGAPGKDSLGRILHEKKMAKTFQAFKIRLSNNSKKGIRRDSQNVIPAQAGIQ